MTNACYSGQTDYFMGCPLRKNSDLASTGLPSHWVLQDAKARFSELVRRVRSEGPQHVTVHGRDEVVVIAAEEFRRLRGEKSGMSLVEVMQSAPHRDIELTTALVPTPTPMPVRDVML